MKKMICVVVLLSFMALIGCETTQGLRGAGLGGVAGGIAGALLDKKDPWRGALIGGVLGSIVGGTLGEMSAKAAQEAAATNQPVRYKNDKNESVVATPLAFNQNNCRMVNLQQYDEKGRLIGDKTKEGLIVN